MQDFASPRLTVAPIAGPVVGDADDPSFEPVFRHDACDVRVMMLHADGDAGPTLARVARGEIVRMQVVSNDFWREREELREPFKRGLVILEYGDAVEISDVWPEDRL